MKKQTVFLLGVVVGSSLTVMMIPQGKRRVLQRLKAFNPLQNPKITTDGEPSKEMTREQLELELERLSNRVNALAQENV